MKEGEQFKMEFPEHEEKKPRTRQEIIESIRRKRQTDEELDPEEAKEVEREREEDAKDISDLHGPRH